MSLWPITDNDDERAYWKQIWIAGYNSNKGIYTREDVVMILNNAYSKKALTNTDMDVFINGVIYCFKPLSLPQSVTINDNNEIIKVIWQ